MPAVVAACTCLLLWMIPLPSPAARPYRIAGARKDARGRWRPVERLEQTRGGVSFRIGFLDAGARRSVLRAALGRDVDLLPGRVDEARPGYLVFVLELRNGSGRDVLFNPGQARLASEKGDMKFALDYSALYRVSRRLGERGPSLEEIASVVFDRAVTIRPGGSVRKLLAFEAPREDRYRTLEV
ncbi:MAG: hypothetical protein ACE5JG_06770, partial [Planctomycetota bacterium]